MPDIDSLLQHLTEQYGKEPLAAFWKRVNAQEIQPAADNTAPLLQPSPAQAEPDLPANVYRICDRKAWQEAQQRFRALGKLVKYLQQQRRGYGEIDELVRMYLHTLQTYDTHLERELIPPPDDDDCTSEEFLQKAGKIIRDRLYSLLQAIHRGKSRQPDFYQGLCQVLQEYFQDIGLQEKKFDLNTPANDVIDWFVLRRIDESDSTPRRLQEIEIQAYYFSYWDDETDEIKKMILPGLAWV